METFRQCFIEMATRDLKPGFDYGEVFDLFIKALADTLDPGFIEFLEEQLAKNSKTEDKKDGNVQSDGPTQVEPVLGDGKTENITTRESDEQDGTGLGGEGVDGVEENEETVSVDTAGEVEEEVEADHIPGLDDGEEPAGFDDNLEE